MKNLLIMQENEFSGTISMYPYEQVCISETKVAANFRLRKFHTVKNWYQFLTAR